MNKFKDGDANWAVRTFLDGTVKESVQFEIKKLALAVLGNHQLKIEESKDPNGFDRYSYCKHTTKQFCPVGNQTWKYRGRFKEYVVHGNTRLDIYLEVLRMLANDSSTYYPIVSFRPDS
ncbi:hypothetical protein [Bacillus thuringiensis]|uniref:hypothetical protein n=1 Tax=Bacillus thuringiensis TaxID=1428 RepID=UPI002FBD936B